MTEEETSHFGWVLLRSVIDEVSGAAEHPGSSHSTEIAGKISIRFSMWWAFARFPSWLTHGINLGLHPVGSLRRVRRKIPDGWTGQHWSCIPLDTQAVCLHHLEGRAWSSVQEVSGISGGIWPFWGSHRLVLNVAGASSSTAPDAAPPPAHGEDRGRGDHSGLTRGLAN